MSRVILTIEAGTSAKQVAAVLSACPSLAVVRGTEDGSIVVETRRSKDEPEEP